MAQSHYTKWQLIWLIVLRLSIGWHFLYEGLVKLSDPNWTSYAYLMDSRGILSDLFHNMAGNEQVLQMVDQLNIWALILTGTALIMGLFSRIASIAAVGLLALYYLSHPALLGADYAMPGEGSYFIINKNLIELFALAVLIVFPTSREFGIDKLIVRK